MPIQAELPWCRAVYGDRIAWLWGGTGAAGLSGRGAGGICDIFPLILLSGLRICVMGRIRKDARLLAGRSRGGGLQGIF